MVHQAIHGYRHGHQLLATSIGLDDDLAVALANLSDSASRSRSADGPYLTGYGRRDGTYVLARTWPVLGAERPNTVITRSLIIPPKAVGKVDGAFLRGLLTEPDPEVRELLPVPISARQHPTGLDPDEAAVAGSYYVSARPISGLGADERERVALAIWSQLWTPARQELWFCTVPDTQRFEDRKRVLRFATEPFGQTDLARIQSKVGTAVDDLVRPGGFRTFVHFVGSGQRSATLMPMFDEAFRLLDEPGTAVVDRFVRLLLEADAAQPDRLRRLKRRTLGFERGFPRWRADPMTVLAELATGQLGDSVLRADASLERWIPLWWNIDPARAVDLIGAARSTELDVPVEHRTAREGLADAFASSASSLITPETLVVAARMAPDAARAALWERASEPMWREWVHLPNRSWFLDHPHDGTVFEPAVRAARPHPDALRDLLRKHPDAVLELVDEIVRMPRREDDEIDPPKDANKRLKQMLENGDVRSGAILRIADVEDVPQMVRDDALAAATMSPDLVGTVAAYAVARFSQDDTLVKHGAVAFARLYDALASSDASPTWEKLSKVVGDRNSWDRCGRLAQDFAKQVKKRPAIVQDQVLSAVARRSVTLADVVSRYVELDEPRRLKRFGTPWF